MNTGEIAMRAKSSAAILAAILSLIVTQQACAGDVTGTITNLIFRDVDGLVYVIVSGAPSGRPQCAAGTSYWMVPNENSDSGKRMVAALLAARMSGRVIAISGKNTCTRWGDGEDINYVNIL
jgi:hypothetical protein